MRVRIKFSKTGHMKYLGHLDIMRYFQKVMRRAEVDIAYTAGFSPHQVMSFASPLGLGSTSEGEYVDIEVLSTDSSEKMIQKMNRVMVDGTQVISYVKLPDNAKNAMASVAAADYRVTFTKQFSSEMIEKFREFLAQDSIMIRKKTKKQEIEMDIRPLIYQVLVTSQDEEGHWFFSDLQNRENDHICSFLQSDGDNHLCSLLPSDEDEQIFSRYLNEEMFRQSEVFRAGTVLFLQLSAGSAANLKPEQVLNSFLDFCGIEQGELAYSSHRLEIYANLAKEGETRKLVPLEGLGEVIV